MRGRLVGAWQRIRGGALSPGRAALSVGVGLFVGSLPLYGIHFALVLAICLPLRLDAAVAYIAAHISNPLTLPFLVALEIDVGSLILTGHHASFDLEAAKRLGVAGALGQLALGSLVVAVTLATVGAAAAWLLAHRVHDALEERLAGARSRTLLRYASAERNVHWYVRSKLRTDPALGAIASLEGSFGRVVDAGCGYGQIGLALVELGRATSLFGIDRDASRVLVAELAGAGVGRFEQADLEMAAFSTADTILFVDSLHYLPIVSQDAILARAAAALAPGGRIVVREVDARPTWRSGVTTWLERRAATGRREHPSFGFRAASDLVSVLERLGLECSVHPHVEWSLLENVLIVGKKAR